MSDQSAAPPHAIRLSEALTPRQIELLLWQIVTDFGGGEMASEPADDAPGRELLVYRGEGASLDLCANEAIND